jgi:hypothetical protein
MTNQKLYNKEKQKQIQFDLERLNEKRNKILVSIQKAVSCCAV